MNHELRTPLTSIKLYLGLLKHGLPENQPRYLDVLNRETDRLRGLIEELLDLSRMDLGQTMANLEPTDVNRLIEELVNDRRELASSMGLTLAFEPTNGLPAVLADAPLLFRGLANLLVNAVNYTPSGGAITLRTATADSEGQLWVTASVADTGLGIGDEDKVHLFERFYRGQVGRSSGVPGTGLGLAMCAEIMSRHGGRITLDSLVGQGSTFTFWLKPAHAAD
jgi:signal transduction histidine kinase